MALPTSVGPPVFPGAPSLALPRFSPGYFFGTTARFALVIVTLSSSVLNV